MCRGQSQGHPLRARAWVCMLPVGWLREGAGCGHRSGKRAAHRRAAQAALSGPGAPHTGARNDRTPGQDSTGDRRPVGAHRALREVVWKGWTPAVEGALRSFASVAGQDPAVDVIVIRWVGLAWACCACPLLPFAAVSHACCAVTCATCILTSIQTWAGLFVRHSVVN